MKMFSRKHIAQLTIKTVNGETIPMYSRFTEQKLLKQCLKKAKKSLKKQKPFAYGMVFESHSISNFASPVVHIEVMYK